MNCEYILTLIENNRYGTLVHVVRKNIHNWSVKEHCSIKKLLLHIKNHTYASIISDIHKNFGIKRLYCLNFIEIFKSYHNRIHKLSKYKYVYPISNVNKYQYIHVRKALNTCYNNTYLIEHVVSSCRNIDETTFKMIIKYMSQLSFYNFTFYIDKSEISNIEKYIKQPKYISMKFNNKYEIHYY